MNNNKTWVTLLRRWLVFIESKIYRNNSKFLVREVGRGRSVELSNLGPVRVGPAF